MGGLNLFGYAFNNPVALIDPLGLAGLSPEECALIREMLELEAEVGPRAAAQSYSSWPSWPYEDRYADLLGHDSGGEGGRDAGMETSVGRIDMDWYTTLRSVNLGSSSLSRPIYEFGKGVVWDFLRDLFPETASDADPYKDKKEATLLDAMENGYQSFADFFTPEFMRENCGDCSEEELP